MSKEIKKIKDECVIKKSSVELIERMVKEKWSSLSVAYSTKDKPNPGDGQFLMFSLGTWKHKGGYTNTMIFERLTNIFSLLENIDGRVEKIDDQSHIGGRMVIQKECFEEFQNQISNLLVGLTYRLTSR